MATTMARTTRSTLPVKTNTPARVWLMILGWVLIATAILGLIPPVADLLHNLQFHIEGGEDFVHWVLGIVTLAVAYFVKDDLLLATIAVVFGVTYLAVGVLGFFVDTIGPWHVAIGDNILHLALGAITTTAGVISRNRTATDGRRGAAV
jgi:hypothetical protein